MTESNALTKVPDSTTCDMASYERSASFHPRSVFAANDGIPWRRVFRVLRKHWKASLAFVLVLEIAIACLVFTLDNIYTSSAVIEGGIL